MFACILSPQIINLSSHAMPPMRLLSKDFIGQMLSSEKKEKPQRSDSAVKIVATMEISDDENEAPDAKIVRRRKIENAEKAMREKSVSKKATATNIESKMKNLSLDCVISFDL